MSSSKLLTCQEVVNPSIYNWVCAKIGPILGQRCIIFMIFLEICGGHHKIVFMNLWDAPRIPSFDKIQFELSSISLCVASLTIDTFLSFTEGPW